MNQWLVFADDEVILAAHDIVMVRALDEGDLDPQTGGLLKTVPEGKRTRIDTRSNGYVWVSTDFAEIVERLRELTGEHPQ